MSQLESHLTPIIWSHFSRYVKNFNSKDFELTLLNGGVFSKLELNLDVLDRELQLPLTFASGHVQELKIIVPWRKITSEPIVLNIKSMELVLNCRDPKSEEGKKANVNNEIAPLSKPGQTTPFLKHFMQKIVSNVRVNFENVVIKYQESGISMSLNVGEACLTPADEKWMETYLKHILYAPDFVLRRKLSLSDVSVYLDRCNNVDNYQEPMLYALDMDVRIIQKFSTPYSSVPYLYRLDVHLDDLEFRVSTEQIPMLVKLYHLCTWLMQSGVVVKTFQEDPNKNGKVVAVKSTKKVESIDLENPSTSESSSEQVKVKESESWLSWVADWLSKVPLPSHLFGLDTRNLDEDTKNTTHFCIYIKALNITVREIEIDRPDNQFLKCSIQGVVCDFILRGNVKSHTFGASSVMVHGLGVCPCGTQDCASSECYFEAGQISQNFASCSLFSEEDDGQSLTEWCYDIDHKECLNQDADTALLEKTPAFFMKYVVIMNEATIASATNDKPSSLLNSEITEIIYHCVAAPSKVLSCSGLLHRLKMINEVIANYDYIPYDYQSAFTNQPDSHFGVLANGQESPLTTYRLVIRQPHIEIFAADHISDYSPEKLAEYFRNGGIVTVTTTPRLKPKWPKMIISCDLMELTAEDSDGHLDRIRRRMVGQYSIEDARNRVKRAGVIEEEGVWKAMQTRASKTAVMCLAIEEVLIGFVSEPVELNMGIKSSNFQLDFSNLHFYTPTDCIQRIQVGSLLDAFTCSTGLEKRCKWLCLPFTSSMNVCADWEPALRSPSLETVIDIESLTLYVGPETIITFSQLSEKLLVYLQEFLPSTGSQAGDVVNEPHSVRRLTFTQTFEQDAQSSWILHTTSDQPDTPIAVEICLKANSLTWRYPQSRMLHGLKFRMSDEDRYAPLLSFEVEYYEECTNTFYPYYKAAGVLTEEAFEVSFSQNAKYCISAETWRVTIMHPVGEVILGPLPVAGFAKSLLLESVVVVPECNVTMTLPNVVINLVNHTHDTGKGIHNSVQPDYTNANTDAVSLSDPVIAALQFKLSLLCYSTIEDMSRLSAISYITMNILNFESLLMDEVMDQVYIDTVIALSDNLALGSPSIHIVTNEVSLKLGASSMHTLTYTAAVWNQIISSFDVKKCKIMPVEERQIPKVLAARTLSKERKDLCDTQKRITLIRPRRLLFGGEPLSPMGVGVFSNLAITMMAFDRRVDKVKTVRLHMYSKIELLGGLQGLLLRPCVSWWMLKIRTFCAERSAIDLAIRMLLFRQRGRLISYQQRSLIRLMGGLQPIILRPSLHWWLLRLMRANLNV